MPRRWPPRRWPSRCPYATVLRATALLAVLAGCSHREPPAPEGVPSVALPELPLPASTAPEAGAAAPPAPAEDTAAMPQTRDVPHAEGPAFEARRDALWDAIVHDDPDRALPFFFPLGAYKQVKDVTDPAADWKHRLVGAYKRDIHALHQRLGASAADAKLVGLDVPDARARWVEPGEEWNRIGYYRVFGSHLRYSVGGEEHTVDVKSLISWRGEWFVVHLSAIG